MDIQVNIHPQKKCLYQHELQFGVPIENPLSLMMNGFTL